MMDNAGKVSDFAGGQVVVMIPMKLNQKLVEKQQNGSKVVGMKN